MFRRESKEVRKLKIELASQRRINAQLRRQLPQRSATQRIFDQALQDARKLIDLVHTGEPVTRQAVHGAISRRRYGYAMALLKASHIVYGGGRGVPYRWRRMPQAEMFARLAGTHERVSENNSILLEFVPKHIRNRVQALPPTEHL